jgi:hypothetical protein
MLKEHDPSKEPAKLRAGRKWKNAELRRRVKEAQQMPKRVDPNREPEIAETITNDGRLDGPIHRVERKFVKDVREMMEGHANLNLQIYAAMIERRRIKLLKEKIRRLKLAQQSNGETNV